VRGSAAPTRMHGHPRAGGEGPSQAIVLLCLMSLPLLVMLASANRGAELVPRIICGELVLISG